MVQQTQPQRPWYSELADVFPGALLTLVMIWAVIQSIANANWASGLEVLVPVVLPAVLAGTIFARLRWLPGWLANLLSAALGLVWTIHRLGPQMDARLITWFDQANELLIRIIMLVRVLTGGGRGEDILLFVAALTLLSWALGYASAWMIFRHGWLWRTVLLNAFIILTNYTYVLPKPTTLFFVFLGAALLLLAYQQVINRQERWLAAQIEFPDFLPIRFVSAAAIVCSLLLLITGLLPGQVTVAQATQTWNMLKQPFIIARERWEDVFSTINAPPGTSGTSFAARNSQLGGTRALGSDTVMYVTSARYEYWRAIARDRYSGGEWQNTTGEQARAALGAGSPEQARTPFDADVAIPHTPGRARTMITQTVTLHEDRKDNLITVGGEALRINLPIAVEHNYLTDQQNQRRPNFDDTALIVAREPLRAERTYTITALVSHADVQSLREAGGDYQAWVRERYLQLPDTITPRTLALAREIVQKAGAATAYEQAVAIQDFLRTLPYNEQINAPPAGSEPVDYFLFDIRQGYCDYYASAMVVMLRSLGVPARWVQGYAGGEYDAELGVYVVRENVAHSWPEVYFPGFGWERFEPTAAGYTSAPVRPLTRDTGDDTGDVGSAGSLPNLPNDPDIGAELDPGLAIERDARPAAGVTSVSTFDTSQIRERLAVMGIVVGSLGLMAYSVLLAWRRELRGLSPAASAYAQVGMLARLGGLPQRPHTTPYEYGAELAQAIPHERAVIQSVVNAYVTERYHTKSIHVSEPPTEADLRQLRWSLLQQLIRRIGVPARLGEASRDHGGNRVKT